VAILAGGESRRMGRDKGSLPVAGVPMLARVLAAVRASGLRVVIVGRPDVAAIVGDDGLPRIADDAPGNGPLGGIATALRVTGGSLLAVACDMPLMTPDALLWLAGQTPLAAHRDGVITLNGGRYEPLFSIYSHAALPLIESLLARRERALRALIAAGDFLHIEAPPTIVPALANINTPEELGEVERGGGWRRERTTKA
jgi:molybdopterin-guanine dinucleotide biosynthesis protein A